MNLKTKLIVTFAVVIAVPLFLISIVFVGFMSLQPAEVVTPQTKEFLGEMLISVILIMAMTCSFLMAWIYRSILSPIETLKKATQNIRDGNLDFEVEIEDNDEIGELCADFEEMRLRLKESTEEKVSFDSQNKELISNISHDLKTPITAVKGYVEGLLDGVADTPEKQQKLPEFLFRMAEQKSKAAALQTQKLTLRSPDKTPVRAAPTFLHLPGSAPVFRPRNSVPQKWKTHFRNPAPAYMQMNQSSQLRQMPPLQSVRSCLPAPAPSKFPDS